MSELKEEKTVSYKGWRKDGKLHREDGPAVVYQDGLECYYLNGVQYTRAEWEAEVKKLRAS